MRIILNTLFGVLAAFSSDSIVFGFMGFFHAFLGIKQSCIIRDVSFDGF
jgi:hypothetical protein